jgi:hypothetical protein
MHLMLDDGCLKKGYVGFLSKDKIFWLSLGFHLALIFV